MAHNTHIALATSPSRKVISISADMLLNFELSPDCLNSAKSFGKSASTSVAAIDAGRPCKTLTRLRMKRSAKAHKKMLTALDVVSHRSTVYAVHHSLFLVSIVQASRSVP